MIGHHLQADDLDSMLSADLPDDLHETGLHGTDQHLAAVLRELHQMVLQGVDHVVALSVRWLRHYSQYT